jgi:hypothetical protein
MALKTRRVHFAGFTTNPNDLTESYRIHRPSTMHTQQRSLSRTLGWFAAKRPGALELDSHIYIALRSFEFFDRANHR